MVPCTGLSCKMSFLLCVMVKLFENHCFILIMLWFLFKYLATQNKNSTSQPPLQPVWSRGQDLMNKMWQKWYEESLLGTLTLYFSKVFHPASWCAIFDQIGENNNQGGQSDKIGGIWVPRWPTGVKMSDHLGPPTFILLCERQINLSYFSHCYVGSQHTQLNWWNQSI